MNLKEIKSGLKKLGIEVDEATISNRLKSQNLTENDVTAETIGIVADLFSDMKAGEIKPVVDVVEALSKEVNPDSKPKQGKRGAPKKSTVAQDFETLATSADDATARVLRRAKEIADQKTAELEEQLAQQMADAAIQARLQAFGGAVNFLQQNLSSTAFLNPVQEYFQLEGTDGAIEVEAQAIR